MDINLWGMLGCAVAYAGAVFAGVEGMGIVLRLVYRRATGLLI